MNLDYDDKGKIFTNVVSKVPVPSMIQTLTSRIHGMVYVRQGERMKDELNKSEQFLAITDVEVLNAQGEVIVRSKFISVNRDHIIWVIPDEELLDENNQIGEGQ